MSEKDKVVEVELDSTPEQGGLVLASEVLPAGLPLIPLRPRPAFPNMLIPMAVSETHQLQAVKRAMDNPSQAIGFVLVKEPEKPDGTDNLHGVGVVGKIVKMMHSDEKSAQFLVSTIERFTIREINDNAGALFATVSYHYGTELSGNPELKAYSMAVVSTLKELVQINPLSRGDQPQEDLR